MRERTVHLGRNIKRIREIQGVKQEALALEMGDDWSQKKISFLESKDLIDDALLAEVAKALKVSPEAIKNFDEEAAVNIINNIHDNQFDNTSVGMIYHQIINPLERWLDAMEENKKLYQEKIVLYERMLKDKTEMIEKLEKLLESRV